MRVGIGFDVHRLTAGRKLVLGGVEIPFDTGLSGHSDADVLLHAICDALLGAAALGDIGQHFPPSDPRYKDVSSLALLTKVLWLVEGAGFRVGNVDSTVIAESPKLSPHFAEMRRRIAKTLDIDADCVSVKATTPEAMGALGRGEGIAAMAVATLLPWSGRV